MSSQWKVYLLDPIKIEELKKEDRKLYALKDEEIDKVSIYGPILIEGDTNARAKSAFYTELSEKPWFKESPFARIPYRDLVPYILVKNMEDRRKTREEPDIEGLMDLVRTHAAD